LFFTCSAVNAVLGRFSSSLDSFIFDFLILGPELCLARQMHPPPFLPEFGRSEYLVQKIQEGNNSFVELNSADASVEGI
jgi:hypothetical protein